MAHQDMSKQSDNDPNAAMDIVKPRWGSNWLRGITAFAVGGAVMQTGFDLLDVQLELFSGLDRFNAAWIVAMTALPFGTGILIGMIYGYGGKYLAHFPPVVVLLLSYYQSMHSVLPEGSHLLPWGIWAVFLILQAEFCAVGGFAGEFFTRRWAGGWTSKYKSKSDYEPLPCDDDN